VKSVAKKEMESAFEDMLCRLRPSPEILVEFPRIAAELWREQNGNAEKKKRKLNAQLEKSSRR
jgi:hypothetical protein